MAKASPASLAVRVRLPLCMQLSSDVTWFMFRVVPPGFIPTQDKLYLIAFAQLPDAASLRSHRGCDPGACPTSG